MAALKATPLPTVLHQAFAAECEGRYGLPERGFEMALAAGVNLFFRGPDYRAQTRFRRTVPPSQRERLHVVAGTFAATADPPLEE